MKDRRQGEASADPVRTRPLSLTPFNRFSRTGPCQGDRMVERSAGLVSEPQVACRAGIYTLSRREPKACGGGVYRERDAGSLPVPQPAVTLCHSHARGQNKKTGCRPQPVTPLQTRRTGQASSMAPTSRPLRPSTTETLTAWP